MLRVLHSNPIIFPVLTLQETNCGFTVYVPINAQSSPYTKISLHLPLSWALIKLLWNPDCGLCIQTLGVFWSIHRTTSWSFFLYGCSSRSSGCLLWILWSRQRMCSYHTLQSTEHFLKVRGTGDLLERDSDLNTGRHTASYSMWNGLRNLFFF